MLPSNFDLFQELKLSLNETFQMVSVALVFAIVLGTLIGLLLFITSNNLFSKNRIVNEVSGAIVNIIRSIPFIILLVLVIPVSKAIVHTSIGPKAVMVPLAVASTAFFARLAETSFSEVSKGVLESVVASGASSLDIIIHILIPEALPQLVKSVTVTIISLIGSSAMAGTVGGGGVGDLAIRYGYQRYNTAIMIICVVVLVVIVQILQMLGDFLAAKLNKR